ncbi:Toxin APEKTx1 [Toxocara canis]|uniref:Toxin APEKTx1 n=1 Tax=Toxocara canis TaxID=6265 RepID=A0A0B2UUJ4_TOXCA|nr:Toxin APEKTx1 [Toxocara canis]
MLRTFKVPDTCDGDIGFAGTGFAKNFASPQTTTGERCSLNCSIMILRECHDSVLCIIFILASGVLCADPNNDTYNFLDAVKSLIFGDDATSNSVCCASSMRTQPPYMNLTVRQLPDITLASRPQAQKLIVYPQPQTFSAHNNQAPKLSIRSVGSVGACNLPQQIGTGPYRIPRWYYNPARMRCELFYWSGCCGNANNFQTFQSCQQSCEGSGPSYSCGGRFFVSAKNAHDSKETLLRSMKT